MRKLVFTIFISGACFTAMHAKTSKKHAAELFTYGNHEVSREEFLRVYKKNSITKVPDMSDTALRNYLNLYSLFRMKVAEADREHLDTLPSIEHELDNYRRQLAKNYLTDEKVTNTLIREAYDRMKEDVHVEHILIASSPGADTMAAYRKIDSIYHLVISGKAKFEDLARQYSDDKGSKESGGDIGYFTSLQTVYPFESMAFRTPVGQVSAPFHTQFGYHILKVLDKRANPGQVKVAQILIQTPKSKGEAGAEAAHKRADSVESMLKHGASFYDLVQKYSEDNYSVKDSGILKPFGVGRTVPAFEKAAFSLKNPGDFTEPIRTEYGYHIIMLIGKYPIQPFDTLYPTIKHKIENDSRSQTAKDQFFAQIKEKNGYVEYPENIREVTARLIATPDTGKNAKMFNYADYKNMSKPVFKLGGKDYLQSDFVKYFEGMTHGKINGPKNNAIRDGYNLYVNNVINDFEEHRLVEENPDFKHLMEEYRDGIMLFELMDRHVWSKAAKDTTGLKEYFDTHKSKYTWEPGFEGSVYKFKNKQALDAGLKLLDTNPNYTDEQIAKELNTASNADAVSIQHGHYEFSHFKEATAADLRSSSRKVIPESNGEYTVVMAKQVYYANSPKTLDEARGYVVAEYQDYLEKQWNEKMRKEYPMTVNEGVFNSMAGKQE